MPIELRIALIALCCVCILAKIQLHKHLDRKHNYSEKSSISMRFHPAFVFPYLNKVSDKASKLKFICNVLWIVFVVLLIVLVVFINR